MLIALAVTDEPSGEQQRSNYLRGVNHEEDEGNGAICSSCYRGRQYLREKTKDEAPEGDQLADEGTLPGELHLVATRAGLGVCDEDSVDEVSHRGAEGTLDILADVVGVGALWVEVAPIRVVGVHGDQD